MEAAPRYIIGADAMARFVFSLLPSGLARNVVFVGDVDAVAFEGRPLIGLREFLKAASPDACVVLATRKSSTIAVLLAAKQKNVLDARELCKSNRAIRHQKGHSGDIGWAAISTIPRSGTYRMRYFLYAFNELLTRRLQKPSPERLYLYSLSEGSGNSSPYDLAKVKSALGVTNLCVGHYLPPGALFRLSGNAAWSRLMLTRCAIFRRSCEQSVGMSILSHAARPWLLEPPDGSHSLGPVRFAFVARPICDQIASLLTVYSLMAERCVAIGCNNWSLNDFIHHCFDRVRPYAFGALYGSIPHLLKECYDTGQSFAHCVFAGPYWRSLVDDYTLQLFAAQHFASHPVPNLKIRQFRYEDMMSDEVRYFMQLVEFMRGSPADKVEQDAIEGAALATNVEGARKMEGQLGHSLFYRAGFERTFDVETHLTEDRSDKERIRRIRSGVEAAMARHAADVVRHHEERLKDLESSSVSHARTASGGIRW